MISRLFNEFHDIVSVIPRIDFIQSIVSNELVELVVLPLKIYGCVFVYPFSELIHVFDITDAKFA